MTNEQFEVHLQQFREIHIRISLFQNFFQEKDGNTYRKKRKIDELQGYALGGSINIVADSASRRSCSIEMLVVSSSFNVSPSSRIWMDKIFQLETGIRNIKTGEIVWFNQGFYLMNTPSLNYDSEVKRLSFQGLDLMGLLDGTLGGMLENATLIEAETPISQAIEQTVIYFGKIDPQDIYIQPNDFLIPYDIEKGPTDTVYSLLEEIKELYMDWEIFFDENGRLIYQRIPNRVFASQQAEDDQILFSFLQDNNLIKDYAITYDFQNVANKIVIWGNLRDDGIQVHHELINENPDSPFNVSSSIGTISFVFSDDKIRDNEQAEQRARFEFLHRNHFNEQISFSCVPIYFLKANQMIKVIQQEVPLDGNFLISDISLPLTHDGTMSVNARKIYPTLEKGVI